MKSRKITIVLFLLMCALFDVRAQTTEPMHHHDTASEHVPGLGFALIKSKIGILNFNPYASARYLNQLATPNSYTDAFGRTMKVETRNDIQLHKAILYFRGWLVDPRFYYVFFTWTSNANQGQGAQVVVAGSFQFQFKKYLRAGVGVTSLPCVRSLLMNFPNFIVQDARPMADEFFRGSFTQAVWAQGELAKGLRYKTVLGNNLSALGVDAGQLDDGVDTWSSALWWGTNDFGALAPYSDFEFHTTPATLLGGSYTRSNETRQSQSGLEAPENTQIRLSDGTGIFEINAFRPNTQVTAAKYEMASFYSGVKFRGASLDFDYYLRWISKFQTIGAIPVSNLFDHGFVTQAAYMVVGKTLDLHAIGSYIYGEYGNPWELIGGFNWYPYKSRFLRMNGEVRMVHRSPVGYLAFPVSVGSSGPIYVLNLEINY